MNIRSTCIGRYCFGFWLVQVSSASCLRNAQRFLRHVFGKSKWTDIFSTLRFFETHPLFTGVRSLGLPSSYVSLAGLAILILA
jgi:hypothetical protein